MTRGEKTFMVVGALFIVAALGLILLMAIDVQNGGGFDAIAEGLNAD
jgi:hypothetical protein